MRGIKLLLFIVGIGWISLAVCLGMFEMLRYFGFFDVALSAGYPIQDLTIAFFSLVFIRAFIEELFFRFTPLILAYRFGKKVLRHPIVAVVAMVIISSIHFGYLHGGFKHVFVQGIGGIFFSLVFLKCGGLKRDYGRAILSSSLAHFVYNATLFTLEFLLR